MNAIEKRAAQLAIARRLLPGIIAIDELADQACRSDDFTHYPVIRNVYCRHLGADGRPAGGIEIESADTRDGVLHRAIVTIRDDDDAIETERIVIGYPSTNLGQVLAVAKTIARLLRALLRGVTVRSVIEEDARLVGSPAAGTLALALAADANGATLVQAAAGEQPRSKMEVIHDGVEK
jgi:hypothetical protein